MTNNLLYVRETKLMMLGESRKNVFALHHGDITEARDLKKSWIIVFFVLTLIRYFLSRLNFRVVSFVLSDLTSNTWYKTFVLTQFSFEANAF